MEQSKIKSNRKLGFYGSIASIIGLILAVLFYNYPKNIKNKFIGNQIELIDSDSNNVIQKNTKISTATNFVKLYNSSGNTLSQTNHITNNYQEVLNKNDKLSSLAKEYIEISGELIDEITQRPIRDVEIHCNINRTPSTISHSNGFNIKIKNELRKHDNVELTFIHDKYITLNKTIYSKELLNHLKIILKPKN